MQIPLVECIRRFSGKLELLVQLEWMKQNELIVEKPPEMTEEQKLVAATAASKARWGKLTKGKKGPKDAG